MNSIERGISALFVLILLLALTLFGVIIWGIIELVLWLTSK